MADAMLWPRGVVLDGWDQAKLLARDVLSLADSASMPDSAWQTDTRLRRAREVLGVPENGRVTHAHLWENPDGT